MSDQIVNTTLYPLDRLGSSDGLALLDQVRSRLQQDGSCTLPDFIAADTLQQMATEASTITHLAYPGPTEVTRTVVIGTSVAITISTRLGR